MMRTLFCYVLALSLPTILVSASSPFVVAWNNTRSYGPDGPWPVVTVQVGTDENGYGLNTVDLHPGGIFQHLILTKQFCGRESANQCPASAAGLYEVDSSHNVIRDVTTFEGFVRQWGSEMAQNLSSTVRNVVDVVSIQGAQSQDSSLTVGNSTIAAADAWLIELPDGTNYSAQVGQLSLGAPGAGVQPFSNVPGFGDVVGNTVPGTASTDRDIPSNSFGLHYGSASLNQVGSLVFGGYDQSRVLGDVSAFDLVGGNNQMIAQLLDIEIGVETGGTPFTNSSVSYPGPHSENHAPYITGLLQQNASFSNGQPTVINPVVPYMYMSPPTCANIAQNLPVTLQPDIGLYTWNEDAYKQIVSSSAYLAFVFQQVGAGNITIKVPFALLNLTLEPPIVPTPQQYFPCRPFYANDGSGKYEFGKAFLQATFVGMNWGENKWFMAQAPDHVLELPTYRASA